jgi:hypothetical protein
MVQSGPQSRTGHKTVRFTRPYGTYLHDPVLGEGRTDSPLDRTVLENGMDTDLITICSCLVHIHESIRNELDRTVHFKTLTVPVVVL